MNKTELVTNVAAKAGLKKKDAESAVNAFMEVVQQAMVEGDKVQLIGFGTFEMKTRPERTGRNPQTGKEMTILASSTLAFKPSSTFKTVIKPKKKSCAKKSCKKK